MGVPNIERKFLWVKLSFHNYAIVEVIQCKLSMIVLYDSRISVRNSLFCVLVCVQVCTNNCAQPTWSTSKQFVDYPAMLLNLIKLFSLAQEFRFCWRSLQLLVRSIYLLRLTYGYQSVHCWTNRSAIVCTDAFACTCCSNYNE